ncbi:hypothetical protein BWK63_11105, partial [Flavobacterium covae]
PINLTPDFIPFRQLGQYEDPELEGLYYNRFRYYDCSIGNYISQDPCYFYDLFRKKSPL